MEKTNLSFIDELKERIIIHEGKINKCYADSLGKLTFGIGHLVTENDNIDPNKEYDDEFIMQIFEVDFKTALEGATRLCKDMDLPDEKFGVFVEMCFQLGVNGVSKFKNALSHAKDHAWDKCADELLDSRWHQQTPNRAKALADVMRGK